MGNATLVNVVLLAIDRLLGFYADQYGGLNLDGLYGLRLIEGQLPLLASGQEDELAARLDGLSRRAAQTAGRAMKYVQARDEAYFDSMRFLVDRPWLGSGPRRTVDHRLLWPQDSLARVSHISEDQSDECFAELIRSCNVSEACVKRMAGLQRTTQYALLHQVLFLILTRIRSCEGPLEAALVWPGFLRGRFSDAEEGLAGRVRRNGSMSVFDAEAVLCANSYQELMTLIDILLRDKRRFTGYTRDLMLEMIFVCGHIGYAEFAQYDMIPTILSWQRPEGCFGEPEMDPYSRTDPPARQSLREEQIGLCLAHMSTVATGALMTYLRHGLPEPRLAYRDWAPERQPWGSVADSAVLLVLVLAAALALRVLLGLFWRR